jgi:class 3 adenylate cyclase
MEEFLTGAHPVVEADRVLATVLFTDIVGSTTRAAELGDPRWKELLDLHDELTRSHVERFGGRVIKATVARSLATFDSPGRSIRCPKVLMSALHRAGIEIRAGLLTGEIEGRGDDVGGIAVHIGARVVGEAGRGVVLANRVRSRCGLGHCLRGPRRSGAQGRFRGVAALRGRRRRGPVSQD